ncbi:MAG TPA: Uma2 family endonuclease [Thermoanaerobaculia bacterium]|nr:Uma2 family endonuclease [Thermoanaerobaculia bacterium]
MTEIAARPATYEDLLKVPDHLVAEIIDGELYTSPRPASPHARASSVLGGVLVNTYDLGTSGPGGWWVIDEPELHLGPHVLVPDLAGWRRERMPQIPNVAWFELSPDWVCEVVSPDTGRLDRIKKMPKYAANGVGHLWLIDPLQRTLEVYGLENGRYFVLSSHGGEEKVHAEPFAEAELPLASLWI